MGTLPLWLLGKHITSVAATLQTINPTTGVLAPSVQAGDTATLVSATVGLIDECQLNKAKVRENINSTVRTRAHWVAISVDDSLVLTEILRQGQNTGLLASLWFSSTANTGRVVYFVFTVGGNSWSGYLRMTAFNVDYARGKNVARLSLSMVEPNVANVAYS